MTVHMINGALITSDKTDHRARSVGEGGWVVSYLPGRTLTVEQAESAIRVAEEVAGMRDLATRLGLTVLEAVGMAELTRSGAVPR